MQNGVDPMGLWTPMKSNLKGEKISKIRALLAILSCEKFTKIATNPSLFILQKKVPKLNWQKGWQSGPTISDKAE